jgi:hypothetical protein
MVSPAPVRGVVAGGVVGSLARAAKAAAVGSVLPVVRAGTIPRRHVVVIDRRVMSKEIGPVAMRTVLIDAAATEPPRKVTAIDRQRLRRTRQRPARRRRSKPPRRELLPKRRPGVLNRYSTDSRKRPVPCEPYSQPTRGRAFFLGCRLCRIRQENGLKPAAMPTRAGSAEAFLVKCFVARGKRPIYTGMRESPQKRDLFFFAGVLTSLPYRN